MIIDDVRVPPTVNRLRSARPLFFWNGGAAVERMLDAAGTTEYSLQGFTDSPAASALELDQLLARWFAWRSKMSSFLENYDVIICPVNACPALPHEATAQPDAITLFSYTVTLQSHRMAQR